MSRWHWNRVGTRYLVLGGWNTTFALGVFALLHATLSRFIGTQAVLVIASLIGIVQSYITQRQWVWRSTARVQSEMPRFIGTAAAQYVANALLLHAATEMLNFPAIPSQVVITAVLIAVTFAVLKMWVFATPKESGTR